MPATIEKKKGTCRIKLSQAMTIETAAEIHGVFMEALSDKNGKTAAIVLEDGGLGKIDVAGLQLLIALKNSAEQRSIDFNSDEIVKNAKILEEAKLLGIPLEHVKSR